MEKLSDLSLWYFFFRLVELMFGTMCNTLEKMFLPEDLPEQANVSPCLLRREA